MERIGWIDFFRGIAMILILVFHTEIYYKEYGDSPYYLYTTNAIIIFYFISGYLFQRGQTFQLGKKLRSIVRSLLIPYFCFTALIALVKVLLGQQVWHEALLRILCGRASWFIAALIVAEVWFSLFLCIRHHRQQWIAAGAVMAFTVYYLVPFNQYNLWQWQDALLCFCFLATGWLYHRHQHLFSPLSRPLCLLAMALLLVLVKVVECRADYAMLNIAITCVPLFLADATLTIGLVAGLSRYVPRCALIEWTGRHSIVYYFLSGAAPMIVGTVFKKVGFPHDGHLYRLLLAQLCVYALATVAAFGLNKIIINDK